MAKIIEDFVADLKGLRTEKSNPRLVNLFMFSKRLTHLNVEKYN
jgi:hypothetical protein